MRTMLKVLTACYTVLCAGKSCAFFMDDMSPFIGEEILQFFVPQVKLMLSSDDWKTVEAAVLALGTVAEGVYGGRYVQGGREVGQCVGREGGASVCGEGGR